MNVLFFTKYSALGGSSKHMVYSYLEYFQREGIHCTIAPLFDDFYFTFRDLATPATVGEIVKHGGYFSRRIIERISNTLQGNQFDVVVVEKELIPYFPFGLEILLRRHQPKMVSLFDDAVHVHYRNHPWRIVRVLCQKKIQHVVEISTHVITWNRTLAEYARQFNPHVTTVDTAIDLRRYHCKTAEANPNRRVVIGWIGTPNSFRYLSGLEHVFQILSDRYDVELRVISSSAFRSGNIPVSNRKWSLETEVNDLCSCDIGIMPLVDDEWTRGKSAYKLVQYMGVGLPTVSSPVGVNIEMISDGVNGFLADTTESWIEKLSLLIENPDLRRQQGSAGRGLVEKKYSIQSVAPRLIQVLKGLEC
ncbi:hypothetical protein BROC_00660 [Candidatus Brocadiaceae bacterium]|nr:hypothetical protein BROC_00660 [Candidatus Brocadiaceae bacterium]